MKVLVFVLLVIGIALGCNSDSSEHGRRDKPGKKSASCQCGWRRHPQNRIVGGEESGINEWPMMAGLIDYSGTVKQQFCGGTIITKRHIVSAAHCFIMKHPYNIGYLQRNSQFIGVVVGAHNWNTADNNNYLQVQGYAIHENYDPTFLTNDVALIAVQNIPFSDIVGPACFPNSRLSVTGDDVYFVGWGYTSWDGGKQMTTTEILKKAKLQAMSLANCSQRLLNAFDLSNPHQLCTYNPGTSVCPGDSGGPLLWRDPELNRYTLVGITSFVPSSGCTGLSGFVDTSAFIDWIKPKIEYIGESLCTKL